MQLRWTLVCALGSLALLGAACHSSQNQSMSSASAMHAGALDGKVYSVELGEKNKSKGDPDNLEFMAGKFHSTACDAYGFGSAAYSTNASSGGTSFMTETRNAQ